jgi:hypothetical protein
MAGDATALAENVHGMRKGARHEAAQILLRRVHGLISEQPDSDSAYRATNLAKHDFRDPRKTHPIKAVPLPFEPSQGAFRLVVPFSQCKSWLALAGNF